MKLHGFVLAWALPVVLSGVVCAQAPMTPAPRPHPFGKREHVVQRLNGESAPTELPAQMRWISEEWVKAKADENTQMPYLAYLPEKDRVLMLVETHQPIKTAFITSEDHGKTWSERKWLSTDAEGHPNAVALGLTNLGGGKLMAYPENAAHGRWVSGDYGVTWKQQTIRDTVQERYIWDPLLVITDAAGQATKLVEASWRPTGDARGTATGHYSQAYLRSSVDEGRTWSDEVKVPQWLGVNEVNLIRANNGDWVAACRLDEPPSYTVKGRYPDLYSGLGVSISRDEGKTWSAKKVLYEFGRHHPSMAILPGGEIVMTYVVRDGYAFTPEGFPQYGVEAVVSHDNGKTWDMDHRYILATWTGNIPAADPDHGWCSPQSTSTVLLPDGTILTAFGSGFRNAVGAKVWKMDVALVRWRLKSPPTDDPNAIVDQQYGFKRTIFSVGRNKGFIIEPAKPAADGSRPWVWYAPTFIGALPDNTHNKWILQRLLEQGVAICGVDVGESYGSPAGRKVYSEFYDYVISKYKLDPKAGFLAQSRGGLMTYNWAVENPQKVRCIAGIAPVCDPSSYPGLNKASPAYGLSEQELAGQLKAHNPLDRLEPLAKAAVPILHVAGDVDGVVPTEKNSQILADRYKALGGEAKLLIFPGKGHEYAVEFFQSTALLRFLAGGR